MKKCLIVLLLGVMLIGNQALITFADNGNGIIISPYWMNTSSVSGNLNVNGNTANFSILINGNPNVTEISATVTLYYKNSWDNWVKTDTEWEYSINSDVLAIYETFDVTPGTEYKVELEAHVYANGITEIVTKEFT